MIYIVENFWPIVLATLLGMVLGFLLLTALGEQRPRPGSALLIFLAEFWLSAILAGALILAPVKSNPWTVALGSAFIIWVGFVLPALVVLGLAVRQQLKACLYASGYWLVVMLAQAAVLHWVGLVKPT